VGPADLAEFFARDLPAKALHFLEEMPFLVREQYLDYLRGTTFRSSVLCRADVRIERQLESAMLERFSVALATNARLKTLRTGQDSSRSSSSETSERTFLTAGTCVLECSDPLVAAALGVLDERRPESIPVPELLQLPLPDDRGDGSAPDRTDYADQLTRFLLDAVMAGAIEPALSPAQVASRVGPRPVAGPLTRLQVRTGRGVTNQKQELIELDALSRFVLSLLDGAHDHEELAETVRQELMAGRLSLSPLYESDAPDVVVHRVLSQLCDLAFLIP
jgi:methyltransferase-like protein